MSTMTIEDLIEERVHRFAYEMKKTLLRNAHEKGKGSWMGLTIEQLEMKFDEEIKELKDALENGTPEEITLEATDVASVVMMLRDNFGHANVIDSEYVSICNKCNEKFEHYYKDEEFKTVEDSICEDCLNEVNE